MSLTQVPTIEPFDCEGDPTSLGSRWERWKRALEIYFVATNTNDQNKKRAILLHSGGMSLQDIYFNIPGAHVTDTTDGYDIAVKKLDDYFSPKQSYLFERHIFRLMKQESDEKFEKFLIRLRRQSSKCNFANEDENLIDQIVEKCSSTKLRKNILILGDTATIEKTITEANSLETVERQLNEFHDRQNTTSSINKIDTKLNKRYMKKDIDLSCSRCGSKNHKSDNSSCPAINTNCLKCGFKGHFQKHCRTRANKRKNINFRSNDKNIIKKYKQDTSKNKEPTSIDYIFHIDDDGAVDCQVGGVNIKMLIDSGSKSNIINDTTWEYMKKSNVTVFNQQKYSDKTFLAYGAKEPLKVLGLFDAQIKVCSKSITAKFYIIVNGSKNLLGKETAVSLNLLKLGFDVNSIEQKQFPRFKDVQLEITIDKTVPPVCQPYRRVPIPLESKINKKIDELVEMDIIEPVNKPSSWVSPMVPVLKPDDDIRICLDMRLANKAITRENHPLPTIAQLIPKFGKSKLFSKLDIKNAFHHVELKENSREITTFITSKGLYRYKRLMFGLSCAPEHFQKIMEKILLPCEGVVNFIDDIVVFGRDENEHDTRLKKVLSVLKYNNVLLNTKKCVFKAKAIQFLGHEFSSSGIKPLDKYIKIIETFRPPETIEEIQSFLGLINFVGKWIPNLSTLTEPIRQLLREKVHKNANITAFWQKDQEKAFEKLKYCLSKIPTLGYYDPKDRTQVMADASPVGLGAVLIQYDSTEPRIIAFGSKSLTNVGKRYCQTEKEALALVWAIEHFHMYLYGKKFELVTDHKPLEVIFGTRSKPCARIERWVLRLQSYDYKVIYKPGKSNVADPLSRLCKSSTNETQASSFKDEHHVNQIIQHARPTALSLKSIVEVSNDDKEFKLIKDALIKNTWDVSINHYKVFQHELWLHDGVLLRGNKIVIPTKLRKQVLAAAHEGHPGIVNMKARLRTKVWWPKIDKDAESTVKNYRGCTLVSAPNPPIPLKRRELPSQAWVDTAIDFLGPLPSGDYLLVIIDYYSRYKEIEPMKSISANDTIKVLKRIFARTGNPASITADNGKQFCSQDFKKFCTEQGIKLFNTIPYWPQQNGEVERQNRDILKRLRISQCEKSDWKDDLLSYLMMYNSTPHPSTGKTPSELFYGRQFRDKLPFLTDLENKYDDSEIRDRDKEKKEKNKLNEDRKRKATERELEVGEKVYVKNVIKENKLASEFNPTPHTVVSAEGSDINVRNDETGQEYRRNIVHLKKVEGQWKVIDNEGNSNKDV